MNEHEKQKYVDDIPDGLEPRARFTLFLKDPGLAVFNVFFGMFGLLVPGLFLSFLGLCIPWLICWAAVIIYVNAWGTRKVLDTFRFHIGPDMVTISSGVFGRHTSKTPYDRIMTVRVSAGFLERRRGLATLMISPSFHIIPGLDREVAEYLAEVVLRRVEKVKVAGRSVDITKDVDERILEELKSIRKALA